MLKNFASDKFRLWYDEEGRDLWTYRTPSFVKVVIEGRYDGLYVILCVANGGDKNETC